MSPGFPRERGAKRAHLLAAVEGIREVVEAGALEAERLGTLPPATVRALAGSGLVALKVPESLGGAEADPVRRGMTTWRFAVALPEGGSAVERYTTSQDRRTQTGPFDLKAERIRL